MHSFLLLALLSLPAASAALHTYKGIRFTNPPRRFGQSGPALPFDPSLPYDAYGDVCVQDKATIELTGQNVTMSEDCLFLNVFTPVDTTTTAPAATAPAPLLPVMVYMYGGGFVQGWSQQMDPSKLASAGTTVQVNFNYRLGALGLLAHPDLQNESPVGATGGMNAVVDQVVALQWVQQNIHLFGGDPEQVTIYGESAGGCSVCYHLVSPLSRGLFKNAIVESGPCIGPWGIRSSSNLEAFAFSSAFMLGAGAPSIDALRAMDVDDLMYTHGGDNYPLISYDGYVLQDEMLPADYIAAGLVNVAPDGVIVLGSNTVDSMDMEPWLSMSGKQLASTESEFEASVFKNFFGFAEKVIEQYYPADDAFGHAIAQISADICVRCPTRTLAKALSSVATVHMYSYAGASADGRASHAAELCELFVDEPTCSAVMMQEFDVGLSESMAAYWTSVAVESKPVPKAGDPEWPEFGAGHLKLGLETAAQEGSTVGFESCDFWDTLDIGVIQLRAACVAI
jgi:para-nitrobenzyl esterase